MHDHPDLEGLEHDLRRFAQQQRRRSLLRWLGGSAAVAAAAPAAAATCSLVPEETAGPYPGDGSNSAAGGVANALMLSGIVRRDIRTSVGNASGTAPGVPFNLRVRLVNTNGGCASLAGYAIYLWHCTRDGLYSMYNAGVTGENYLRGVQVTDADGIAGFQTIFPGCYLGRVPHMHFEIYRSLTTATSFSNRLRTSQLAFPLTTCQRLYANADGYATSLANLSRISFATDNVFSDGYASQLVTMRGDGLSGLTGTIQIGVSV